MRCFSILLLVTASSVGAFETDYSLATRDPDEIPQFFLRGEVIGIGIGKSGSELQSSVLLIVIPYVEVEFHHVRAGLGLMEGWYGAVSSLPLSFGYTIYDQPVRYWGRLYGKVPEVYVKATARFYNWNDPPPEIPFIGTLEAVYAVDSYGVGLSASVGLVYTVVEPVSTFSGKRYVYPFIGVQVHLPVARIGF